MMGKNGVVRGVALLAATAFVAFGGVAQAAGTVFGGVVFGGDNTAYLGASIPLPGARVGEGLAVRGIVAGTQYEYDSSIGRIEGEQVQADLSLIYQFSSATTYFDIGLGARYVDTQLEPDDPGSSRDGGQWEVVVSASGQQTFGPWQLSQFGSYGFDAQDYYVRGDVTHQIGGAFRLGVEVQIDGSEDYDRQRYGAVLGFSPSPDWSIKVSGGVTEQTDNSGGYGGVTFQTSF